MTIKRIISLMLAMLLVLNLAMLSVSAYDSELVQTGSIAVEITSYEQLKKLIYNSPNGELYVLQNDIIVEDNKNDNEIVVGSFTDCTLDLNGYTLSRTTRGIDSCLINVTQTAVFSVVDSSDENSGKMVFSSGNYAGTSSVIIANGNVDIYGGSYEIKTPYKVGGGTVLKVETGYLNIYDGVFDSHTAFGGDTIELRHNAYLYNVPHCNIFGGTFYGKQSNFEVSSYSDFSSYGCFYPSVYVFGGEFYIANPDDEYAGFAYCNNGWGQVIVAQGTVFYKCFNSSDQRFIDGVTKNHIEVEYEGKNGQYYEVTPPSMIGSEELSLEERLAVKLIKKEVSYYSKKGTVYQNNQEYIDSALNYVDTIEVEAAQEESPLLWIENTDNVKTVSWYMSDEEHFDGENTPWSELADFRGNVLPFRFDFRPESDTTVYIRSLITMDNGEQVEDVICIHYEELNPNPPINSVNIIGVDKPAIGDHPDFNITSDDDGFYVNAVYWTDITTDSHKNLKETDVFEAGHTYELEVWLRTNENYKFKTDEDGWVDITATIDGKKAEIVGSGAENAAILSVTYTLDQSLQYKLGDVDGNGAVSIMDATLIQLHIAQLENLTDIQLKAADTDKNSNITIMDATQIQLLIAQLIEEF